MNTRRILLAHKNPIVLCNLADELKRRRVRAEVLTAQSETLLIQQHWARPSNVVLVDLAFTQAGRLLKCLSADPAQPGVCVCADASNEKALAEAARDCPCRCVSSRTPVGVICDQLESLLRAGNASSVSLPPRREDARRLLFLAGAPPHTKGGRCLRLALEMIGEDEGLLNSLNGRLYPALALRTGDTPENVERCMRYAVGQMYRRMPPEERLRLLPRGSRVTVRRVLCAFADRLNSDELTRACLESPR